MALPDFVIIGAMKAGTTSLFDQFAAQPGIFMSDPKEPEFFSDDATFAKGMAWYEALFGAAPPGTLKGEGSTGYTKRPSYPKAAERLAAALPDARLIYVTRDPFDRLVSHVIHEWTQGVLPADIDQALAISEEPIAFSRYAWQLEPYVRLFGKDRILVTSLEAITRDPSGEFARMGVFLGAPGPLVWRTDQGASNVSAERLRKIPLQRLLIDSGPAAWLRRRFVPQGLRDAVKARLRMRQRPSLSAETRARLAPVFAADYAALSALFPEAPLHPPPMAELPEAAS
ncbi:MAG: sulfotransferase [Pseudomonadota bacterium]